MTLVTPNRALQFVKGDIQSADLVNFVLEEDSIDTVMHFAAQVLLGPPMQRMPGPLKNKQCYFR